MEKVGRERKKTTIYTMCVCVCYSSVLRWDFMNIGNFLSSSLHYRINKLYVNIYLSSIVNDYHFGEGTCVETIKISQLKTYQANGIFRYFEYNQLVQ